MRKQINLTVSESKRLIARGVCELEIVKERLNDGLIVIPTGSTNGYIIEEFLDKHFDKRDYMTGKIVPEKVPSKRIETGETLPDIVLQHGKVNKDFDRLSAPPIMEQGDIFIKGANALNYESGVAGILIGHPEGGTIGAAAGHIVGKGIRLVIPVGLEKCTATDIYKAEKLLNTEDSGTRLWPVRGTIVTEIEALQLLFDVKVWHIASGGLAGAEGGVRLLVEGDNDEIKNVLEMIDDIQGEPPFYPRS